MKKTKFLPVIVVMSGILSFLVLVFMILWNTFLVPAFGVITMTYWLSIKGCLFVCSVAFVISAAKQIADFGIFALNMYIARKQVSKELATQEELIKHFKMFGKGEQK